MATIIGTAANDTLNGTADDDRIEGGAGNDTISGNDGNDTLLAGSGSDSLFGGNGNDLLDLGTSQNPFADGGAGDDTIVGGTLGNFRIGGPGNDRFDIGASGTISYRTSPAAIVAFMPGSLAATTTIADGFGGIDTIIGTASFEGTPFADRFEPADAQAVRNYFVDALGGDDTALGGPGDDYLTGFRTGNKLFEGRLGNDFLRSYDGSDTLLGGAGNDTLWGGAGSNVLAGGDGIDEIGYQFDFFSVVIDLAAQTVLRSGAPGQDTISGIEAAAGGNGNDRFAGSAGNDTFKGWTGHDTFEGSAGIDMLRYDHGGVATVASSRGIDLVQPAGPGVPGSAIDNFGFTDVIHFGASEVVYGSDRGDQVTGLAQDDTFFGSSGDDTLIGGPGNDSLAGEWDNDRLEPGSGLDTIDGGPGTDLLVLAAARASYAVSQPLPGVTRLLSAALGVDVRFSNVENVQFSDGTRTLAQLLANQAPVQVGDLVLDATEDLPLVITAAQLLARFTDPDGDPLQVSFEAGSEFVPNGTGSWTYTPPLNYSGSSFTSQLATVSDGRGGQLQVQLQIRVAPVNDAPLLLPREAGIMPVQHNTAGDVNGVFRLPDARLLVALSSGLDELGYRALRLAPDGRIDTSWGVGGEARFALPGIELPFARAAVTPSGGLVMASGWRSTDGAAGGFLVVRFMADGQVDAAFNGGQGYYRLDLPSGTRELRAVEFDPLGRIVVTGWASPNAGGGFAALDTPVLRLTAGGTPDLSFGGGDGLAWYPVSAGDDRADAIAFRDNGRIVVAGRAHDGVALQMCLLQLLDDGSIDASFGNAGLRTLPAPGYTSSRARACEVLGDGSVLVTGFALQGSRIDIVLTRVLANGQPDTSFGNAGWAVASGGDGTAIPVDIVPLPGGRILVHGSFTAADGHTQPMLARFFADGRADTSFGNGGVVLVANVTSNTGFRLALLDDGAMLIGARAGAEGTSVAAIARLGADGAIDRSFAPLPGDRLEAAGVPFTVSTRELLDGWVEVDAGDDIALSGLGASTGSLAANGDGTWTVTPPPGITGPLTISYTVGDGHGGASHGTRNVVLVTTHWQGTAGNDQYTATSLAETLAGLAGDDRLDGAGGNDSIDGGSGNYDWLSGGDGNDTLDGGAESELTYNIDIAVYTSSAPVSVNLPLGNATQSGFTDTLLRIDAIFSGDGGDSLRGADGPAALRGETLRGAGGDDSIDGGNGVDTAEFLRPRSEYTVTRVDATNWTVRDNVASNGDEGTDRLTSIERIVFADQMLSFGERAEELARVAFVLWTKDIVGSPALFARGLSFYDVGYDFETMSIVALQFWTGDSDTELAQRLISNSGSAKTTAQLLATMAANGGSVEGRAAALREIALDPATTTLIELSGIRTVGLVSNHFVPGFGTLFQLLPEG